MKIAEMKSVIPSATTVASSTAASADLPRPRLTGAEVEAARKQEQPPAEDAGRKMTQAAREELQAAVEQLNQTASSFHRSVRFNLHDDSGRVQVSVVDTDSDKIIREIPPKETLNVAKRIRDFLGVLLDEKR